MGFPEIALKNPFFKYFFLLLILKSAHLTLLKDAKFTENIPIFSLSHFWMYECQIAGFLKIQFLNKINVLFTDLILKIQDTSFSDNLFY